MNEGTPESTAEWIGRAGKIIAFVLFTLILILPPPEGLPAAAQRTAAVTGLMATLWLSGAIPVAATSLIPLVAFPLLGIQSAKVVSKSYISSSLFLFLGGFIIAMGIEKWGLHRRIALHVVRVIGTSARRIVLGFMAATACLSMWISNTASTLLMLPIGLAMLGSLAELAEGSPRTKLAGLADAGRDAPNEKADAHAELAVALLLGIAYAANIGGFTTLVGTPTNIAFQTFWEGQFPDAPQFSAGEWMAAVAPLSVTLLLCTWGVLVWRLAPHHGVENLGRKFFTGEIRALGRPSRAQWLMLGLFVLTAGLWIFRKPFQFGAEPLIPGWGDSIVGMLIRMGVAPELASTAVDDSTVAMGMALLMFVIPARRGATGRNEYLMDWDTAERLPWGVLLLIGGGFALASAFVETGLSEWLGSAFAREVAGWPNWLLVAAVVLLLTFLTELTTNVATINVFLPVLAAVALDERISVDPRLIVVPATIATSCAFMLPIATPPNAIVFGSGKVSMLRMAGYGFVLNIISIVLITLAAFTFLLPQLGVSLDSDAPPTTELEIGDR